MIKKLADRFLKWFCNPEFYQDIRGDLEELFQKNIQTKSKIKAEWSYVFDVLLLMRLSLIRPFPLSILPNQQIMIRNHIKIAFRYMRKQKLYSFIKIGGFALGIAACLLLTIYLKHELSYDTHYQHPERIFRLTVDYLDDDITGVDFPAPIARTLVQDYPEIEKAGRYATPGFMTTGGNYVRPADKQKNIFEEGFAFFDQELVEILQIPMVYGKQSEVLNKPDRILISRRKADKYFPGENPVGKILILNNDENSTYTIGGVMENFPANSHLHFDFLLTMEGVELWSGEQSYWGANNYDVYVQLRPGTHPEQLNEKINEIITNYYLPSWKEREIANAETYVDSMVFNLQAINDIHLNSEGVTDRLPHGDRRLVWIFGTAAILIFLIACINFINLSTAKSANRAKEVGIRKTLGAFREQLMNQFLVESVLFSLFSFGLGILLAIFILPWFNHVADKNLIIPWQEWWFFPGAIILTLLTGLFAGFYPSVYLSSFIPVRVLKGNLGIGSKNPLLRKVLVVFQFTASIVLIIGTLGVNQQLHFILNTKIGFDKDQLVMVQGTNTLGDRVFTFKEEIAKLPGVQSVSISDYLPIRGTKRNGNPFVKEGRIKEDAPVYGQIWRTDMDYIQTLGMKIIEGRDFSPEMATDSQAVIINQAMASALNLDQPIGKRITNGGPVWPVIGMVEDFHFESLREEIYPLAIVIGNSTSIVSIKANSSEMASLIPAIEEVWTQFASDQPIRYTFMDERYAIMYSDVQRSGRLFSGFAILAIIIACLGLFGLTAFISEQRTREIGIRKILGASVSSIVGLLSREFILLVLISIFIASPIAWYIIQEWLKSFAYSTTIQLQTFFIAGSLILIIAFLTMSFHSIKSARADPVESLRNT